jgi:hypothetical protein
MALPFPETAKQFQADVLPRADIGFHVDPLSVEMLISLPIEVATWTAPFEDMATFAQLVAPTLTGVYERVLGTPEDLRIPAVLTRAVHWVADGFI